eukprot:TRINITY_DN6078_c0_g1_i1.p1 TRINITY_DN6078_c0_g1~~TRINITY_DN6078_c0_g1_i1.p1  ORF type:complete len:368 (-),score=58.51 TRINITY_DN6078_c0_g1_i1:23-1126(-)
MALASASASVSDAARQESAGPSSPSSQWWLFRILAQESCCCATARERRPHSTKPAASLLDSALLQKPIERVVTTNGYHHNTKKGSLISRLLCPCRLRTGDSLALTKKKLSVAAAAVADPDAPEQIAADVRLHFQEQKSRAADWVSEADARRLLVATEGDAELARSKLKHAVEWKLSTLDDWLEKDNKREVLHEAREMRLVAWGHQRRPLTYHCSIHQRRSDILAEHWACCWHKAFQQAEDPCAQVDIVADCHGFNPFINTTITPYLKLASSIDSFFAERIHRFIVIDFPRMAGWFWKGISPLIAPKTRAKVYFIRSDDPRGMEALYELCVDADMRRMLKEKARGRREGETEDGAGGQRRKERASKAD